MNKKENDKSQVNENKAGVSRRSFNYLQAQIAELLKSNKLFTEETSREINQMKNEFSKISQQLKSHELKLKKKEGSSCKFIIFALLILIIAITIIFSFKFLSVSSKAKYNKPTRNIIPEYENSKGLAVREQNVVIKNQKKLILREEKTLKNINTEEGKLINTYLLYQKKSKSYYDRLLLDSFKYLFSEATFITSEDGEYCIEIGSYYSRSYFQLDRNELPQNNNLLERKLVKNTYTSSLDTYKENPKTTSFSITTNQRFIIIGNEKKLTKFDLDKGTHQDLAIDAFKVILNKGEDIAFVYTKKNLCRVDIKDLRVIDKFYYYPDKDDYFPSNSDFKGPYVNDNFVYFYTLECLGEYSSVCKLNLVIIIC